jgi:hypothetical protein
MSITPLVAHNEVCNALDTWSANNPGKTSLLTRAFMEDVCSGSDMSRWKNVRAEDVMTCVIPRPRMLLALRAGIVLLPILLTWLALSQVVDPYAQYTQNVDAGANFLWFWQSNPNGVFAGHWKLSHIALMDAVLLSALVVLSVRISWYESSVVDAREREYDELVQMLNVYLTQGDCSENATHAPSSQHQSQQESHPQLSPQSEIHSAR